MNKKELKRFIVDRKSELAKCQIFIDYLQILKDNNDIAEMVFSQMLATLNRRYYFLATSINDHEKLLTND